MNFTSLAQKIAKEYYSSQEYMNKNGVKYAALKALNSLELPERPETTSKEPTKMIWTDALIIAQQGMHDAWTKALEGQSDTKVCSCGRIISKDTPECKPQTKGQENPKLPEKLPEWVVENCYQNTTEWWNRKRINEILDYLRARE